MKLRQQLPALLCAGALLLGTAAAASFSDVAPTAWYAPAVEELSEAGILGGMPDGSFAPDAPVNRATVVTVLWRLAGKPAPKGESFPDAAGSWYADAAAWCRETGVAGGYPDGTFGGGRSVTRQELAVFLCNYSRWKGLPLAEGTLGLFADGGDVASWAEESVRHAVGMGILQGSSENRLEPEGRATRGALAVMLQRMLTPAVG